MASEHLPHHARLDCSISLARANVIVVLLSLPTAALLYILYFVLTPFRSDPVLSAHTGELVALIILLIVGIPGHELLHALGWIAFGRLSRRRVRFGFKLNTLTPYAHLQGALPVVAYRMGVILPLLVLGLPPYILGILLARQLVMIYGLFFILAAGGDLLVLWLLRRVPAVAMVQDHPSRAGCQVQEQEQT